MKERALKRVSEKRQYKINQAKAAAEQKLAAALSIPEIAKAHEYYVNLRFKAAMQNGITETQIQDALKTYKTALKNNGLDESDFQYTPFCPVCRDTGVHNSSVCKCVWMDYIYELKKECKILEKAPFTFQDFNTSSIKDEIQRETLQSYYGFMKQYSDKLPDVKLKNIVFSGGTGTGKTCLAAAVARNAVENGKSCKFMSAFEFNNEMLSAHTSPVAERAEKLHDVLTADLLVIDDLGVEPRYKNVTAEYLLLVLEERTRSGLCTIITTNLNEKNLQDKYGDRISSRLFDKRHSKFAEFIGNDLRLSH